MSNDRPLWSYNNLGYQAYLLREGAEQAGHRFSRNEPARYAPDGISIIQQSTIASAIRHAWGNAAFRFHFGVPFAT